MFKKGAIAWEYLVAFIIAAFILFLLFIFSGEVREALIKGINKLFDMITGG